MNKYDKKLIKNKAEKFANRVTLGVILFILLYSILATFTGDVKFVIDCQDEECGMRYSNDRRP